MVWFFKVMKGAVVICVAVVAAVALWLSVAPPLLLRVGDGYAAKIVCSNVFLAGRDPGEVLAKDVQAPGHPLLKLLRVSVDRKARIVTSRFMGLFAASSAVYRDGLGCASIPDGNAAAAQAMRLPPVSLPAVSGTALWPEGSRVEPDGDGRLAAILSDRTLAGPGMRAIVVVKDGRIVAEAYGHGFDAQVPLLGWSMTKTVNAAILGRRLQDRHLSLDDAGLFAEWQADERAAIRIRDLLAMESGLQFNEDYGSVTDVTRMLYLEPDMAAFAAAKPLEAGPGTEFNYSSGTAVLLSHLWMRTFGDLKAAHAYPKAALFAPIGMASAVLETDASGTFVGGSYLYATGRDLARFGQFLLQDGVWAGERLLPKGFVAAMATPTVVSGKNYTQIQAWHSGPRPRPGDDFGLPDDVLWMQGHDGQTTAIVPSADLVVVRMGLTPGRLGYRPQPMLKALLDATR